MTYIGRFAPSPTGPLHFGSLIAAFGSWLDARANRGRWLVRIEDLDPPREMQGAIELILNSLKAHGLDWDGELLYQSEHLSRYDEVLNLLSQKQLLYACECTRKQIKANEGIHKRCQSRPYTVTSDKDYALRLAVEQNNSSFEDCFQGKRTISSERANEDFIVKRKDGLHAYMLAVIVDDIEQEISHVIRGDDLADSSCQQVFLFQQLDHPPPIFGHLPLALHPDGHKLSKQTHAAAIDDAQPEKNLLAVLKFLNQPLPDCTDEMLLKELLDWAVAHWQPEQFRGIRAKQAV